MKARIIETGEIINIADYSRAILDKCNSYGNPINLGFDEVEFIKENTKDDIEWEQRRYELAKDFTTVIISAHTVEEINNLFFKNENGYKAVIDLSVSLADSLIKKLKGE